MLHQGLAFCGHDESEESHNRGNFLELMKLVADQNEKMKNVVLTNGPPNRQMVSPTIQNDIVNCFTKLNKYYANFIDDVNYQTLISDLKIFPTLLRSQLNQ